MPAVKGDIYDIYLPLLSPLMLWIGGTTIVIGEHRHDDLPARHALDQLIFNNNDTFF
jgi:hypothetical protein